MRYSALFIVFTAAVFCTGCSDKCEIVDKNGSVIKIFKSPASISKTSTVDEATTAIAKDLLSCSAMAVVKNSKIATTSFVSNSDVSKTSETGRVLAETLSSKLRSAGVTTVELKSQPNITLSSERQGEFALSREIKSFRASLSTNYAVVGMYDFIDGGLMLNSRLLNLDTGIVLSSSMVMLSNEELVDKAMQKSRVKLIAKKKDINEVGK
jgi:hypothetical protein